LLCGALALSVAAAQGADAPKFGDYQAKGFLTDYTKLAPQSDGSEAYRYRNPGADFPKYKRLLVDRIKIWFKDDSDYKGIDPDELKMLTDYFYTAIEKAVGDAYPMVAEPGPDVMRLRIAVTDLVPNKPEASVTSLVVPFLWVGEASAGAVTREPGSTPFTGEATIEFEALDSVSSEQISAYIETRVGKKYRWTEGIGEGVSSYMQAYSKWDYTKKSMDEWAKLLRKRLDQVHGKVTASR
ncbi:MAG TPA: DUF3313 domain-containing protein, partial [Burkholderiales bacterium]|nr:DUF3313 domain-containing protein [Burkholderiales bacterium]